MGSKPKQVARLSVTLVAAAAQRTNGMAAISAIAMDLRRGDVNGPPAARVWREEEEELDCGVARQLLGTAERSTNAKGPSDPQKEPELKHKKNLRTE